VRIGLVIVGDELLSGKRQDRHLSHMIELLAGRGLGVAWVRMLGDDLELLASSFGESFAAGDLVFSFGGIGGTPDDLTRQAAARALGVAIERHPEAVAILESKFGDAAYPNRIRMAELPSGATLIPNPVNQIPGFSVQHHHFVPGFPNMAWPMVEWVLAERYPDLMAERIVERSVRVLETPESELIPLMEQLILQFPSVKPFSLPSSDRAAGIELGLKGPAAQLEPAFVALVSALDEAERPWIEPGSAVT
jgi:molybdopterin-biosynthesis enzyme MoeA-like protein